MPSDGATEMIMDERISPSVAAAITRSDLHDDDTVPENHTDRLDVISPLDVQVGGQHYKLMAIQPIEYILANGLGFCEGCIVKYVSRYQDKGGVEDLMKAKHFIDILIEKVRNDS